MSNEKLLREQFNSWCDANTGNLFSSGAKSSDFYYAIWRAGRDAALAAQNAATQESENRKDSLSLSMDADVTPASAAPSPGWTHESWLDAWDSWMVYIRAGGGGDWPRLAFTSLLDERDEIIKQRDEARREYEGACNLVARMHHSATGSIAGPIRGVVEDVEDLYLRADKAEAALADLRIKMAGNSREYEVLLAERDAEIVRLRKLVEEAPIYFAPEHDFDGKKLAWLNAARERV